MNTRKITEPSGRGKAQKSAAGGKTRGRKRATGKVTPADHETVFHRILLTVTAMQDYLSLTDRIAAEVCAGKADETATTELRVRRDTMARFLGPRLLTDQAAGQCPEQKRRADLWGIHHAVQRIEIELKIIDQRHRGRGPGRRMTVDQWVALDPACPDKLARMCGTDRETMIGLFRSAVPANWRRPIGVGKDTGPSKAARWIVAQTPIGPGTARRVGEHVLNDSHATSEALASLGQWGRDVQAWITSLDQDLQELANQQK